MQSKLRLLKLFFVFLCFLPVSVSAYYNPGKPSGFVNDFSKIFSLEEKNILEKKLFDFEKETSNEIVVVIIPNLQEDYIENFAEKLFQEWGIGKKEKDNGILLLVAIEDRKVRIETGYGLEGSLPDITAQSIIENNIIPKFKEQKYYDGISDAVDNIILATKNEYVATPTKTSMIDYFKGSLPFLIWLFWFLFMILGSTKSWWLGGILGLIAGFLIGLSFALTFAFKLVLALILGVLGLIFDYFVSKSHARWVKSGKKGGFWGVIGSGGGGSGGFGGFGGGHSGGGGSSGSW